MAEPNHKRCLGCGYILDGLPEPRCPECGREFNPLDPRTFAVPSAGSGKPLLIASIAGALALAAPLTVSVLPVSIKWKGPLIGACCPIFGGLICSLIVIGRALDVLRRPALNLIHLRRARLALLISALATLAGFGLIAYSLAH